MGMRIKDGNKLTVKASKNYLYLVCGFLALPVFVLVAFLPGQFANGLSLGFLGLFGLAALPSVYFFLIYKNKRLDVDVTGIVVHTLLGFTRRYSWDGITGHDRTRRLRGKGGGVYRGCEIRHNGRKVVEVPFAFDGYSELIGLLKRRGALL